MVLRSVVPFLNEAQKRDLMEQYLARTFCASLRRWAAEVCASVLGSVFVFVASYGVSFPLPSVSVCFPKPPSRWQRTAPLSSVIPAMRPFAPCSVQVAINGHARLPPRVDAAQRRAEKLARAMARSTGAGTGAGAGAGASVAVSPSGQVSRARGGGGADGGGGGAAPVPSRSTVTAPNSGFDPVRRLFRTKVPATRVVSAQGAMEWLTPVCIHAAVSAAPRSAGCRELVCLMFVCVWTGR